MVWYEMGVGGGVFGALQSVLLENMKASSHSAGKQLLQMAGLLSASLFLSLQISSLRPTVPAPVTSTSVSNVIRRMAAFLNFGTSIVIGKHLMS